MDLLMFLSHNNRQATSDPRHAVLASLSSHFVTKLYLFSLTIFTSSRALFDPHLFDTSTLRFQSARPLRLVYWLTCIVEWPACATQWPQGFIILVILVCPKLVILIGL